MAAVGSISLPLSFSVGHPRCSHDNQCRRAWPEPPGSPPGTCRDPYDSRSDARHALCARYASMAIVWAMPGTRDRQLPTTQVRRDGETSSQDRGDRPQAGKHHFGHVGQAKRMVVAKDETTIVDGAGDAAHPLASVTQTSIARSSGWYRSQDGGRRTGGGGRPTAARTDAGRVAARLSAGVHGSGERPVHRHCS
jgi:hypothetical protein